MLRWRLILEDYGLDIEYIKGDKNILADALSIFLTKRYQETKQKSNYQKEIVSELNDIEYLKVFPLLIQN